MGKIPKRPGSSGNILEVHEPSSMELNRKCAGLAGLSEYQGEGSQRCSHEPCGVGGRQRRVSARLGPGGI